MATTSKRPNVVLIVSDDHGYADRGALRVDPHVNTPALDRLAAEGVTCAQAYVTAPICSPSRAGLIGGQYQQRWGARWFDSSGFPDHLPSLAERFAELGYATGYLGKVHYGQERPGDRGCPPHHGFAESYYGLAGQQMGRLNYLHHSRDAVERYGPDASWRMAVQPLLDGDDEVELEGFLTDELGHRARDFVARHQDEPFFLMLAFNAVHNFCFQLPDEELDKRGLTKYDDWDPSTSRYVDWYDGAIWPDLPDGRAYYLAQLELMDAQIGRLLDELDRRGLAEDTIVVYTTDNGGSTCNFGVNTPLRGTKYTLWEGGIRVPFLVRWPAGGVRGGGTNSGLVSTLDLYPTLLSAAGATPTRWEHSDGLDQLDALRGDVGAVGHEVLHWDCGFQWAVREGDWKLHSADEGPHAEALRRTEHADVGVGSRLTHLGRDVGEETDWTSDYPEVVARLRARHDAWRAEVGIG
ncbi:sulfatase family protein [Actinopolymorpha pittospori]|uniref:Arylsulfatase A-like enzyme n=1 Tax=Actinopolymorpha pittospori TaxID=648752 RepID=A0A927RHY8_9ACTN|nr:sulfatase-like hydrolase/transferase [Actinopolymorpha pittospori]MBE1612720.1 arylsulfatase A-like enzyme [Actinopolymorpha pittospori]